jgi:AcrR family transcriptional regulator
VYGVFKGLGDLLYALLDRQEERALNQLFGALPTDLGLEDPDAYLIAAVRHLIEIVSDDPHTWRPILLSGEGTPLVVRERIARDRDVVRGRIEWLLDAGLRLRGAPEVYTEMASHALIAVAEYFGRMLIERPDQFDPERLVAGIEGLLAQLRR